jgi:hypothetical protein
MCISIDEGAYPFVLQGSPRGRKPPDDLRALFVRMAAIAQRAVREGTFHVVVAVGDEDFNAHERKLMATCMAEAAPELAARVVGAFAVVENAFARGVLTALRWLAPGAIPVVAAATPEEAIELARAQLRANGVNVSDTVTARAIATARKLHSEIRRSSPPLSL